jgi:hypothetical protein
MRITKQPTINRVTRIRMAFVGDMTIDLLGIVSFNSTAGSDRIGSALVLSSLESYFMSTQLGLLFSWWEMYRSMME